MKRLRLMFVIGSFICALLAISVNGATADTVIHPYGSKRWMVTNTGGKATIQVNRLMSAWTGTLPDCSFFVTKEMWSGIGSGWVEVGAVDGAVEDVGGSVDCNGHKVLWWDGFYTAYQDDSGHYAEFTYGTPFSSWNDTPHNLQVSYIGSNWWRASIDGATAKDFWFPYTTSWQMTVGHEGQGYASSPPQFTNGRTSYNHQALINGVWTNWTDATGSFRDIDVSTFHSTWGTTPAGATDFTKLTYTCDYCPNN